MIQIRSKSIICYNAYAFEQSGGHRMKLSANLAKVRETHSTYSGKITKGSKKRMTKAISLLIQSTKTREIHNPVSNTKHQFKLSFITLTIPECNIKPDAKFCNKNLLEPFIRVLRRRYGLKNYVWKLELQSNGMVHYHFTSNMFIVHTDLRNEWNNLLRKNSLLVDFHTRTGKHDPNSTDIHSVKNVNNLEAYLIKYVTKDDQNSIAVNGKIWDCSLALKKAEYFTTHSTHDYQDRLRRMEIEGNITSYAGDRFIIYQFKENPVHVLLDEICKRNYYIHLNNIRNHEINEKGINTRNLSITSPSRYGEPNSTANPDIQGKGTTIKGIGELIQERLSSEKENLSHLSYQIAFHSDEFS